MMLTEAQKRKIVLDSIKSFKSPCLLKSLLISGPFGGGFLGDISHIELETDSDGRTHIGVKDVFDILGDEKDALCRYNNKLIKSILLNIDALVNDGSIVFNKYNFQDKNNLTYTDVGILDDDVQQLYDKYTMGLFQISV